MSINPFLDSIDILYVLPTKNMISETNNFKWKCNTSKMQHSTNNLIENNKKFKDIKLLSENIHSLCFFSLWLTQWIRTSHEKEKKILFKILPTIQHVYWMFWKQSCGCFVSFPNPIQSSTFSYKSLRLIAKSLSVNDETPYLRFKKNR